MFRALVRHRLSRDCRLTRHTALRCFHSRSATVCFALPADPSCRTIPRFSVSLLGPSYAPTCMRAYPSPVCLCSRVCTRVRTYVSLPLDQSLFPVRAFFPILAPLRVLHQEVVSVRQAGTPRTYLSLWQCSDRATHLSTDALPVSGGVVAKAVPVSFSLSLSLSLFPSHPRILSFSLPRVGHPLASATVFSPSRSYTLRRLVLRTTVRVSLRLEPRRTKPSCAPGANTNPCGSPDARRRR